METQSVRSLLEPKLTQYAEWRKSWPLWTGDQDAWASEAWVDRIHWSANLLLSEISIGLMDALGPSFMVIKAVTKDLRYIAVRKSVGDAGTIIHPLPDLYKLRVLATAAQFSESMPAKLNSVVVPLLDVDGIPKAELVGLLEEVARQLTLHSKGETLVSRMARFHQERGAAKSSATPEIENRFALELTRQTGLTVERRGTARNTVSRGILRSLRKEAREIVSAVRKAKTAEKDLLAIARIVAEDNQVKPKSHSDPENWVRLIEARLDTLRSQGSEKLGKSWVAMEARQLQFPFLLRAELAECANSKESDVALGDKLLLGRLPAKIKRATLQSIAARAD